MSERKGDRMVEYKIKNTFNPVALEDLKLEGKIARLNDTFFNERVLSDYAKNIIYKETEEAFEKSVMTLRPSAIGRVNFGANG